MAKWTYTCNIKDLLDGDTDSENIARIAVAIITRLDTLHIVNDFELDDILYGLQCVAADGDQADVEELDGNLALLYDWADDRRVWLGL